MDAATLQPWSLKSISTAEYHLHTMNLLFQSRKSEPLVSSVSLDEFTKAASVAFDYQFDGTTRFYPFVPPPIPSEYAIGLIVGPSGSGKSTLLTEIGKEPSPQWDPSKAIVSQFSDPSAAINLLSGVGLNTIPAWMRPYQVLSTGEKFRADLARKLDDDAELIVVDEFTSTVDRNVAKAASCAVRRLCSQLGKRVVLASCHYDIVDWLQPDWVFDTMNGEFHAGRLLRQRPPIKLEIVPCKRQIWSLFKDHHYLSSAIGNSARCFMATWDGNLVGFASSLAMPCMVKNAWREHRTVILPDYQGMGIGPRLSDAFAQLHLDEGKRYFSRTAHPRFGLYRDHSPLWKPTSKHRKLREDVANNEKRGKQRFNNYIADYSRVCFSHEYVGQAPYSRVGTP